MNDKIRQLARQAQVGSAEFGNGISYFVSTEETFNKFAQLLVAECAMFSMVITDDHYDVDALYKHFGVEE